jgi:hypothetical protein
MSLLSPSNQSINQSINVALKNTQPLECYWLDYTKPIRLRVRYCETTWYSAERMNGKSMARYVLPLTARVWSKKHQHNSILKWHVICGVLQDRRRDSTTNRMTKLGILLQLVMWTFGSRMFRSINMLADLRLHVICVRLPVSHGPKQ